jgi:predicted alpha/beta-hydrolase family hydrolase
VTGADGEPRSLELETPHGLARAHLHEPERARALLVLGHGAGGGIGAPDLERVSAIALAESISVALVEQPYRVAGRRSPAPARQLDAAFASIVGQLAGRLPLLLGGRSSGARVACRTASELAARGVLCLAFPLLAPPRRGAERASRLGELEAVAVPVLVIQGASDPFGMPPPAPGRTVVAVAGDHGLRTDLSSVARAARDWLRERLG